jgi:hypothetical protein
MVASQAFGFWAADTRHDGVFIGWLGLRPVTLQGTEQGEVEHRLHRTGWTTAKQRPWLLA